MAGVTVVSQWDAGLTNVGINWQLLVRRQFYILFRLFSDGLGDESQAIRFKSE